MPTPPHRPRSPAGRERTAALRISHRALMFDLAVSAQFRAAGIQHLDDAVAMATREIQGISIPAVPELPGAPRKVRPLP